MRFFVLVVLSIGLASNAVAKTLTETLQERKLAVDLAESVLSDFDTQVRDIAEGVNECLKTIPTTPACAEQLTQLAARIADRNLAASTLSSAKIGLAVSFCDSEYESAANEDLAYLGHGGCP